MIQLDYRDARPIYTQIVDGYREQILTGILLPEDKLPSVREGSGCGLRNLPLPSGLPFLYVFFSGFLMRSGFSLL